MRIPGIAEKFDYWDLRVLKGKHESLDLEDDTIKSLNARDYLSVGLRVLRNGSWSFTASNDFDLNELFRKALKLSKIGGVVIPEPEKRTLRKQFKPVFRINPFNETAESKIKALKNLNSEVKSYSKVIKNSESILAYDSSELLFADSTGSEVVRNSLLTRYLVRAVASRNGFLQQSMERMYVNGGLEFFKREKDKIPLILGERVVRLLNAKHAPAKRMPVVCDNEMAGVFFHEAVGHACEADAVIRNASVLKGKIGEQVASSLVTFSDYPGPRNSFGYLKVDDEGVMKKETVLIKDGVLKNYLHSLHTASALDFKSTGNGRSMTPHFFPIPRMTTLRIRPKSFSEQELVESTGNGVLVKGFKGGEVNPTEGKFVFGASEAFMIEKGDITTPLRDVTISGSITKTMHGINGVSKKPYLARGGMCGKAGQYVPVNEFMPWISIDEVLVGGRSD